MRLHCALDLMDRSLDRNTPHALLRQCYGICRNRRAPCESSDPPLYLVYPETVVLHELAAISQNELALDV